MLSGLRDRAKRDHAAYRDLAYCIDGAFLELGAEGHSEPDCNPATGAVLSRLPHAARDDLDAALAAAQRAFAQWRKISPLKRSAVLRKMAAMMRDRAESIPRNSIASASALPFGLSLYLFTKSLKTATNVSNELEAAIVDINHGDGGLAETPFGGVKESSIGIEGGTETFDGYLVTKFVTWI